MKDRAQKLSSKLKKLTEGLTFDDILLLPQYTEIKRSQVNLATSLHPTLSLKIPVISSPMDTVTEEKMAVSIAQRGGLGIIHRNLSVSSQAEMITNVKKVYLINHGEAAVDNKKRLLVGAAVGAGEDLEERLDALIKVHVDLIVVDSGHGFSKPIIDAVKKIKKLFPRIPVMGGNVATREGAKALVRAGADILRVGMGPGSICTTRIVTGMGVPQLTAISEAVMGVGKKSVTIVADGGIRQMGDMAKALAFGADAVMLGSLLSGFDESPGEMVSIKGKKYKQYRGMGSVAAMQKGSAERYGQSKKTIGRRLIAEGVEGLVEYKGNVSEFLAQVEGSLKSSFYYLGSSNIKEFFQKAEFIKISRAGLLESHPHTVAISNAGGNYKPE